MCIETLEILVFQVQRGEIHARSSQLIIYINIGDRDIGHVVVIYATQLLTNDLAQGGPEAISSGIAPVSTLISSAHDVTLAAQKNRATS